MISVFQALASGLATGAAYALIALGFSITYTATKTLNFSQGEFVSVGSFVGFSALLLLSGGSMTGTAIGAETAAWMFWPALIAAVLIMGVLGVLMYLAAIRPFAGRPGMSWVLTTIGFGVMLQSVALGLWGPAPVSVPAPFGDAVIRIGQVGIRSQEIVLFGVALCIMAGLDWVMRKTMLGKAMKAVAHDRNTSRLMGINVNVLMLMAFFVSSALAGLGGFLIAPIASASVFMGMGIALKGFSGAIVGGLSNPRGSVLGGFALGLLESMVNLYQAQWREIIVFGVVILILTIKPYGLFGTHKVEKV